MKEECVREWRKRDGGSGGVSRFWRCVAVRVRLIRKDIELEMKYGRSPGGSEFSEAFKWT